MQEPPDIAAEIRAALQESDRRVQQAVHYTRLLAQAINQAVLMPAPPEVSQHIILDLADHAVHDHYLPSATHVSALRVWWLHRQAHRRGGKCRHHVHDSNDISDVRYLAE